MYEQRQTRVIKCHSLRARESAVEKIDDAREKVTRMSQKSHETFVKVPDTTMQKMREIIGDKIK